jgi:hypothetical protein
MDKADGEAKLMTRYAAKVGLDVDSDTAPITPLHPVHNTGRAVGKTRIASISYQGRRGFHPSFSTECLSRYFVRINDEDANGKL